MSIASAPKPLPASRLVFDKRRIILLAVRYGLFLALGVWVVAMSFASEHFLTWLNVLSVARQAAPIVVIAVGMTFVMATAGIDLSVGSLVALISVLIVTFFGLGLPTYVVLPGVLFVPGRHRKGVFCWPHRPLSLRLGVGGGVRRRLPSASGPHS